MNIDWDGVIRAWQVLSSRLSGQVLIWITAGVLCIPIARWGIPPLINALAALVRSFRGKE